MNKLYQYWNTPKLRTKSKETELAQVSTGANTKNADGQWLYVSVRCALPIYDWYSEVFTLQMDRETAIRVVEQLTEYLAARNGPSGHSFS